MSLFFKNLTLFSLFCLCIQSSVLHLFAFKVKAYLNVFVFFYFISLKDCKTLKVSPLSLPSIANVYFNYGAIVMYLKELNTLNVQHFTLMVVAMTQLEWVVFRPQSWWFNPWQVFLDKTLKHLVAP